MKIGKRTSVAKELTRQERNKQNNIKRISIAAAAAFVLFICLIVIQSSILNQEKTFKVYQVSKDLPVSTKLTEANIDSYLTLKEVQESLIPSKYITDKKKMLDKFVNRDYKINDIITEDGLTDTEKLYKDSIKNPIEIALNASNLSAGVGGILREGDYINIYGLRKPEIDGDESPIYLVDDTYTFKHVYITKAFDGDGIRVDAVNGDESASDGKSATLFNIIISEDDTDLFNEMIKNCDIKISKLLYETTDDYTKFVKDTNKEAAQASKSSSSDSSSSKKKNNKTFFDDDDDDDLDDAVQFDGPAAGEETGPVDLSESGGDTAPATENNDQASTETPSTETNGSTETPNSTEQANTETTGSTETPNSTDATTSTEQASTEQTSNEPNWNKTFFD